MMLLRRGFFFNFDKNAVTEMTKAEEAKLHNLFINLKNEGKTLQEIGEKLEVEDKLLNKWNEKYDKRSTELSLSDLPFKQTILGVNDNDEYIYTNFLTFNLDTLGKIKFDLARLANAELPSENRIGEKAQKYLAIFDKYFNRIKLIHDSNSNSISSEYELNNNTDTVRKLAEEAIHFYGQVYLSELKINEGILIKNPTANIYQKAKNILPYALKSLQIEAFQGIVRTGFEGLPIDSKWIFLIGENGYGKTTLLQAIALGLLGEEDEGVELVKIEGKTNKIGIEYYAQPKSVIHNIYQKFEPFKHLACYGPSRLQIQTDQSQNDIAKKSTTTYGLFNSDGILLNIEFELLIWFLEPNARFDAVKRTLLRLIPYLADIQVDVRSRKVLYIEKEPTDENNVYAPVLFSQLASGFRSILALVGDMMIRLYRSQPTIIEPSELSGIVIIDELDLHWHPKMQREIPQLLSSIFPNVQFIASTHSLVPLLGAPENSVVLKVNRTQNEGITIERLMTDIAALSTDELLRDVFNLEKYLSDEKQQAWERYNELKALIHFEKDTQKKKTYFKERRDLGDRFDFPA
jgi:AAA15 family ATPase/GTPase